MCLTCLQSIGFKGILLYGNEEQKKKYLPDVSNAMCKSVSVFTVLFFPLSFILPHLLPHLFPQILPHHSSHPTTSFFMPFHILSLLSLMLPTLSSPQLASGRKVAAYCLTEPTSGSDASVRSSSLDPPHLSVQCTLHCSQYVPELCSVRMNNTTSSMEGSYGM